MTGYSGGDREGWLHRDDGRSLTRGKTWLIRFTESDLTAQFVTASGAEIHGDHLVFLRVDGSVAALAVLESVESWSEIELPSDYA
jgi:hypothetical protein